jgi:hypothetical protein
MGASREVDADRMVVIGGPKLALSRIPASFRRFCELNPPLTTSGRESADSEHQRMWFRSCCTSRDCEAWARTIKDYGSLALP